jgi:raffinose/stachyose/melibiose transport system permease protein
MTRYTKRTFGLELVMIAVTVLFAFPLYVLVNLSLRPQGQLANPLGIHWPLTLDNYSSAWHQAGLGRALFDSVVVTAASVAIVVGVSSLAAYPLARSTSRLSKSAFALFMLGLLLPFQLALLPLYTTMRDLHLLGSLWGLVLFYSGLQVPFCVFLYTAFLRSLPRDYEEAAVLDGCSALNSFWRVVFPLLRPITGTVVILNAIFIWNDFLTPLLYLSGSGSQTIPVAIFTFVGQYSTNWQLVFAGLVMGVAPILLVYFAMQKQIIRGFSGGLKG